MSDPILNPMTNPENSPHTLSLLYDGDCPFCKATVAQLQHWGLLAELQVSPLQEADWASPELWERGRVEVLLVAPQSTQVWGGMDAIIQLMTRQAKWKLLSQLLNGPGFHRLAQWLYQTIAYNRRILSPISPSAIPCACDPPANSIITQRFYTLLTSLILLSLMAFAQSASLSPAHLTSMRGWALFNALTTATVVGWLGAALSFQLTLKPQARQLLPQTLVSLTGGSLYLLLASLLMLWLPSHQGRGLVGTSGIIGLCLGIQILGTAPMLQRRLRTMGAPAWSPWLWLLTYLLAALGCLWLLP